MAPQRALHNRIWEHESSTILFSSVQNNSTDRVRCHPWSALIFWNAKIKPYAWPPSAPFDLPHGSNTSFFPSYIRKLSQFTLLSFFFGQMAWNAIVCETRTSHAKAPSSPYLETHVSKISGAFPTYKKIKRKSTRMAQYRKHGAIPQKRRNGNSARARTAQSRAKTVQSLAKTAHSNTKIQNHICFPKNGACQKFQRQSDETLFC